MMLFYNTSVDVKTKSADVFIENDLNFEWTEDRATVSLKWTDFKSYYIFWNKCKAVYVFQQLNEQSFIYFFIRFFKYLYSSLDNFVQYTSLCKWKINWAQNIRTSCFVCFCFEWQLLFGVYKHAIVCYYFFLSASRAKLSLLVLIASVSVFVCLFVYSGGIQ